ncbi:Uncharacterized protein DBV15_11606, partial [Temnothorax longispinosus]
QGAFISSEEVTEKRFIKMLNSRNSTSCLNSSNARSSRERKNCLKRALQQTLVLQEVANGSTINKLDEAINEVDHVTSETSIEEKGKTFARNIRKITVSELVTFRETGTLDPLEKKIIVRKKPEQRVASQPAVTVPDKLVPHANTKDEDSVERTVRKIKKLITCYCKEAGKPLDFFQLILHPHDFGRTIRNMLYISFLVKDGVMKLKKDHRSLVVEPYHKEINSQQKRSSNRMGIQNVTSLNMKQWRILKKAYRLEQPMIDFDEEK